MIASNLEPIKDPRTYPESSPTKTPLATYPRLRRVLSPVPSAASTVLGLSSSRFKTLPVGSTIEVSPSSFKIARQIGELLRTSPGSASPTAAPAKLRGGCGLIIDYGGAKVFGNSFRVRKFVCH